MKPHHVRSFHDIPRRYGAVVESSGAEDAYEKPFLMHKTPFPINASGAFKIPTTSRHVLRAMVFNIFYGGNTGEHTFEKVIEATVASRADVVAVEEPEGRMELIAQVLSET